MNFISQVQQYQSLVDDKTSVLRFPEPNESEYRQWMLQQEGRSAKFVMLLMAFIWLIFLAADFIRLADADAIYKGIAMLPLVISIRAPVMVMLLVITAVVLFVRPKLTPTMVQVSYFVMTLAASIISNIYETHGEYQSGWIPIVLIAPIFMLPIGVTFQQLLRLSIICAMTIVVCYVAMLEENQQHLLQIYFFCLLISLSAGLTGGYHKEKGFRTNFLLLRLSELQTFTDPLTNLGNRRFFTKFGTQLIDQAKREGDSLFFIILDLDWFKQINDTHGHKVGDKVLVQFSKQISAHMRRPMDFAVRLGGEEFAIMFYDSNERYVINAVLELQQQIKTIDIQLQNESLSLHLSFSAGIASLRQNDTLDTMYSRADRLMYEAKSAGRDRYIYESSESD